MTESSRPIWTESLRRRQSWPPGSAFEHAVAACRAVPTLDVGIHLTLVEELPVLEPRAIPSLVDSEGRLHPDVSTFTKKLLLGKIRLN